MYFLTIFASLSFSTIGSGHDFARTGDLEALFGAAFGLLLGHFALLLGRRTVDTLCD
jgi:hypothetical protein